MVSKTRVLAIACAFAFLAVFAAPAVSADMNRPTWTAGDFWQYTFTGNVFGTSGSGGMRIEVVGPDSTTVGVNTYATYRTRMWINVTSGGVTLSVPGDAWYRTSDLALVRQTMTFSFGPFTTTTAVTYDPPEDLRWPLRSGSSWSAASTVTTVTNGNPFVDTETAAFFVQQEVQVTVPAGTFTATPLRQEPGDGSFTIAHWSAQVGNSVRTQEDDGSGGSPEMSADLQSYRYQGGGLLGNLWLILLLLLIVIVIIVAAVLARRRRGPAAVPPPGWQQPGVPPQQQGQAPPQAPPQPWQPPQQPPPGR